MVKTHDGTRKTEKNEKRIFFPKNIDPPRNEDDQIEWDEIELPAKCHEYFDKEWEKISKNENQTEWVKILEENPKLLCDQEREILNNSRKNNQARINSEFDEKAKWKE